MAEPTPAEQPEQWESIGEQFFAGAIAAYLKSDAAKRIATDVADIVGKLLGGLFTLTAPIGIGLAKGVAESEDIVAPALADIAAAAASDMFGTNVPSSAFASKRNRGGRNSAADALGRGILEQIQGKAGSIEPGSEAAQRYLGMVLNMALEGWYQGWFFEFMTSLVPIDGIGKIESFAELDDTLAQALGLGRLSRRVLGPLVDTTVVTPLEWQTNKTYRPNLLSSAEAIRQLDRGRWPRERVFEELARQGWSDERIEALINGQRKFFSPSDVRQFVTRNHWTHDQGLQHLRDQGYDEQGALDALRLAGLARIEELERQEANALITAYANGDIDKPTFLAMLDVAVKVDTERALLAELADVRHDVNIKHITAAQVERAVRAGILNVGDYRAALRNEGYDEDSVLTLELLLRHELDVERAIDEQRAQAAAERAAERQAREEAAAKRRTEVETERALHRRGSLSDLERAVVRGLIPFTRLEEVLNAQYDPDTVAILVGLVESDRQRYLDEQRRAAEARQRAERRSLDIGAIERAVLAHVVSVADYRTRLAQLGFDAADVDVLAATLAARLADQEAAAVKRAEADTRAEARLIDLGRFEQLVRRGVRTLSEYGGLLEQLGFDEPSRAALVELLQLKIADDAAAAEARARLEGQRAAGGLTVNQFRRAVVLGLKTADEFDTFLTELGVSADEHALLVAELADDLAQAAAARQRRAQTGTDGGNLRLPLSTVARAARLGIIAPDTYQQRLEAAGYTADDIAIELELLVLEMADVQGARDQAAATDTAIGGRALTLADLARAVKAGVKHLEDYRARALELGYSLDGADTLTRVLAEEVTATNEARIRRTTIASALQAREISLAALDDEVRAGTLTIESYVATLEGLGLSPDDAELLGGLLADELAGAAAA